jgi:putative membrane protein
MADRRLAANLLCVVVAVAHLGFLVLEMFLWDHPIGRGLFSMTPQISAATAVLAMNQGLYNGFLAAGLLWGMRAGRTDVKVFFLVCVIVAGVFGAVTASPVILFVQAAPAMLALVAVLLSERKVSRAT